MMGCCRARTGAFWWRRLAPRKWQHATFAAAAVRCKGTAAAAGGRPPISTSGVLPTRSQPASSLAAVGDPPSSSLLLPMTVPFPGVWIPSKEDSLAAWSPPTTEATTLDSGLRVISQETYAHMSAVGVIVDAGSAYEVAQLKTVGAAHLAETLAWSNTMRRTRSEILRDVDEMGGYLHATVQREQGLFCIDVLREAADGAVELLAECLLMPRHADEDVLAAQQLAELVQSETSHDLKCKEAIHTAAYGVNSPLGSPLYSPRAGSATALANYRAAFYSPDRTVLAATGVAHRDLVEFALKYFEPHMPPASKSVFEYDSPYRGGVHFIMDDYVKDKEKPNEVRIILACEATDGWANERELVTLSVLQTLLGGGDSFSAGGPGKGMYSRLYREVLNYNAKCEAAEAYVSVHKHSGLLGIAGAAPAPIVGSLAIVFAKQLRKLGTTPVDTIELERAKNMLKASVLTQLESRLCLFEDIARQYATFGKRQSLEDMANSIDAVTADDILQMGQRLIAKPPAFAAVGKEFTTLPSQAYLAAILKG